MDGVLSILVGLTAHTWCNTTGSTEAIYILTRSEFSQGTIHMLLFLPSWHLRMASFVLTSLKASHFNSLAGTKIAVFWSCCTVFWSCHTINNTFLFRFGLGFGLHLAVPSILIRDNRGTRD
jgi:hypothetical protein